MNLTKLIGSFNFKKFSKASRTDFGVLKVAFKMPRRGAGVQVGTFGTSVGENH